MDERNDYNSIPKQENRGGKRLNAGSKPKYNEPTKTTAFRIPISKINEVKKLVRDSLAKAGIRTTKL